MAKTSTFFILVFNAYTCICFGTLLWLSHSLFFCFSKFWFFFSIICVSVVFMIGAYAVRFCSESLSFSILSVCKCIICMSGNGFGFNKIMRWWVAGLRILWERIMLHMWWRTYYSVVVCSVFISFLLLCTASFANINMYTLKITCNTHTTLTAHTNNHKLYELLFDIAYK